ncbi:phage tail family protein [Streptomyces decoyicus]|uniref:hypothetical protein n=1 Tax=Streptomyces decoyicus TaxID=249567 RepID=UPI002E1981CE
MAGLSPGYRFTDLAVQLGDLTFGVVDDAGVHWHCATLDGWDSPDVRAEMQQREGDHGAWAPPVYLNERVIALAGKAFAPSAAALDGAIEQLSTAASLTDTTLLVGETVPKMATVRRSGKVLAQRLTGTAMEWSVQVTAADPRRYAPDFEQDNTGLPNSTGGRPTPYTVPYTLSATTVSGQVDAYNAGNIDTRPTLTISGPVSQPSVFGQMPDGSVRMLACSFDLGPDDVLVIDTDAHSATLNGNVSRRRFVSAPQGWPTIPAKGSVSYQFRAATYSSTALLNVRWRSAWM